MIHLSTLDLSLAAALVIALAALSWWMRLGIGVSLMIAATRTAVQLLLIGLVLKTLFENAYWWWVLILSFAMIAFAGREIYARQKWRFTRAWGWGIGTLSMFVSSFSITVFALVALIGVEPWYAPQYAIPLLGMMLGNTMNGIALALDHVTQTAVRDQRVIEQRLALGQTWQAAVAPLRNDGMRVGMMPMINAMAAAGIVSLPGMMTGQILAGAAPVEAVKYQILVMFMIAAGTGFGTLVAVVMGTRRLFDSRARLQLESALKEVRPAGR